MEFAIMLVYLIGTSLISYFAYLKQKKKLDTEGFMVEKKQMGVFTIVCAQLGVALGGGSTVGVVADVHSMGVSGAWLLYSLTAVHLVFALFTCRFLYALNRKYGIITVPGAFLQRYDNKVRVAVAVTLAIYYLLAFSLQPLSAAALLSPILGIGYKTVAWIVGFIFIIVVILGGLKGIAWMNIVHSVVMLVGMGLLFTLSVNHVGGIAGILSSSDLPETFFKFNQPTTMAVLGSFLAIIFGNMFNSLSATLTFGAKSAKTARTGILICVCLMVFMTLFPVGIGLAAKIALPPDIVSNSAFTSMTQIFGTGVTAFCGMAIIAAIFSSGPSDLLVSSNMLTKDLFLNIKPGATDKQQLLFTRLAIVVLGILSLALATGAQTILSNMWGAFQITAVPGIVMVVGLLWKRVDSRAAFWTIVFGSSTAAIWHFSGQPFGISPFWASMAVSFIILIPLTLLSKEKEDPGYDRYKTAMKELKEAGE